MVAVPVRQPRFLGEKVPYREQPESTMQERIQQELGSGYTVEKTPEGYLAKSKSVQYVRVKDTRTKKVRAGQVYTYASYVPDEIIISPEGKVLKETKRSTYQSDASGPIQKWEVYETEVTDYQNQTSYTYGKRDLKSGRETIKQTSSLEGGRYKEKRIIDQDTKEYEQSKQEHDLFKTFADQGRTYAEARQLSRMTKAEREAKFRAEAKARTQIYSLQGKAITLQHQKQRELEKEYRASATKYGRDIIMKQEAARIKPSIVEQPKPVGIQPLEVFEAPTPASPTTRTDMAQSGIKLQSKKQAYTMEEYQPFQFRTGHTYSTPEKYMERQMLESNKGIVVFGRSIPGTVSIQRGLDRYRFGYAEQVRQLDFNPVLSEVVVPASVGATNIIFGTAAHPVQAVKSMLEPVELVKNVRTELTGLTRTKGEVYSLSYLAGTVAGAEVIGRGVKKGLEFGKDVYVKAGAKYVEPETVFEPKSVSGEKTFFTVRSTAESLEAFNKGGRTYNIEVAQDIVRNPQAYAKPPVKGKVLLRNEVLRDVRASVPKENIVYTGGVARRVLTGRGRIRDIDVVTVKGTPKESAYAVAKQFPEKYEIIQHEKYPAIYRLRSKQTGKVVADFDPVALAEEGLINPKSIVRVGEYDVVKPEVLLKSKATQILKGKVNPAYPFKQAENIQQLSPGTSILKEEVIVSHISPAKIKGQIIEGKMVEKFGLEDTGLYVAPKGKGSTLFTGIKSEGAEYTLSLNPFKNIFGIPSATEIAVRGAKTYPESVVMKPGFEHLAEYQKSQAGQGYVWITKRSQIGTGDIPRQRFFLSKPTTMSGKVVKPGYRWEAGTSEGEAVIGESEMIEYVPKTKIGELKGFEKYTVIKGRAVAVREARLLQKGDVVGSESVLFTPQKIKEGAESLDVVASESKVVTPAVSVKGVPFGSFKVSSEISTPYSIPTGYGRIDLGGVSTISVTSSQKPLSGLSKLSPSQSVSSKVSSIKSVVSPVSGPVSTGKSKSSSLSSVGGLSSGKSFGGSSRGESSGGGSSGGISGPPSGPPSRGGPPSRPPTPPEYPRTYSKPEKAQPKQREKFRVEVRRKGVFKTIAITETPERAFKIGKVNVEQTAAASLRVSPVGTHEKVTGVGKGILPLSKFRLSAKEPDVFIQRKKFRIGTPGEKREITQRGILALKGKKIFGGLI